LSGIPLGVGDFVAVGAIRLCLSTELGSVLPACQTVGMEPAHVRLSGDPSGEYIIEDRRPDGRVLLRPDLSVKAMLSRHGERDLTPEEFEQHFRALPTDGEG
jgi:hypothetical protein